MDLRTNSAWRPPIPSLRSVMRLGSFVSREPQYPSPFPVFGSGWSGRCDVLHSKARIYINDREYQEDYMWWRIQLHIKVWMRNPSFKHNKDFSPSVGRVTDHRMEGVRSIATLIDRSVWYDNGKKNCADVTEIKAMCRPRYVSFTNGTCSVELMNRNGTRKTSIREAGYRKQRGVTPETEHTT